MLFFGFDEQEKRVPQYAPDEVVVPNPLAVAVLCS